MNIKIVCVGNIKERFFRDACDEYIKRLGRFGKINITEIKECRGGDTQDVDAEGKLILKTLSKTDFNIALCVEAKQLTSENLAQLFEEKSVSGTSCITFVIGGSDGLSDEVKNFCDFKLGFSKMTFPHQLMRVILLEQVYRAFKISNNESYHK